MSPQSTTTVIACDAMRRVGDRTLFKNKGGPINYAGHGRAYRFFFELGSNGVLIYVPKEIKELSEVCRGVVLDELRDWLAQLELAPEPQEVLVEDDERLACLWKGCGRRRLKGKYVCRYHYEQAPESISTILIYKWMRAVGGV